MSSFLWFFNDLLRKSKALRIRHETRICLPPESNLTPSSGVAVATMSPHDYDLVRRQLDTLLGPDRNKIPGEEVRQGHPHVVGYSDPSICKGYLLGLCLSTLSVKRRGCLMSCNKVHSDEARREFEAADHNGCAPEKRRWQRDLADDCRTVVNDEDRRIQAAAHRLKAAYGFEEPASAIVVKDLSVLQSLGLLVNGVPSSAVESESDAEEDEKSPASDHVANTETKVSGGDVVGSGANSMEIRIIGGQSSKNPVFPVHDSTVKDQSSGGARGTCMGTSTGKESKIKNTKSGDAKCSTAPTVASVLPPRHHIGEDGRSGPGGLLLSKSYKQRVCGQCGGLFSLYDAETRLASHFSGKQHTSLVAVREKLHQLEESLRGGYDVRSRLPEEGRNNSPVSRPIRSSGSEPWDARVRQPRSRSPRRGRLNGDRDPRAFSSGGPIHYAGFGRRGVSDRASKRHRGDSGQTWIGRH